MPKKLLWVSLSLCAFLYAADNTSPQAQNEQGKGWIRYEDDARQTNQPTKIDPKTTTEKELLIQLINEQRVNNRLQAELLEILKVVHDLPRMVEVNGKRCLSNSSEDCYVTPIIGDAARIPVMRKWIENPTVENALAYYKWQAKYLNQMFNAGYSLEMAANNTRYPFAATSTHLAMEQGNAHEQRDRFVKDVLRKYSANMELAILIGKNYGYDTENIERLRDIYDMSKSLGIKTRFVFENQEALNRINDFYNKAINRGATRLWTEIPNEEKVISPNTFKSDKIDTYMTPMYLFRYLDVKSKKSFNQVVGIGRDRPKTILDTITRSMIVFGIIKPEELSGTHAQKYQAEDMLKEIDGRTFLNYEDEQQRAQGMKEAIRKEIGQ